VNIDPAPIPNLNTVDQCRDKCESYGGACKGWTLTQGKCYVKSSVGSMRYDWYVTASGYCFPAGGPGPTPTPAPPTGSCGGAWNQNNNDGVNIDPAPIPNLNTVDQCRDKCESYGGACKGWTLTQGKCYVKSSVGSMRYDWYVTASGYCFPAGGPGRRLGAEAAHVPCPVSGVMCSGNQCCPGVTESGYKTFPCPSAFEGWNGCAGSLPAPTVSPTLGPLPHCACSGNQCCPGVAESGGKTYPCQTADADWDGCETGL